MKMAKTEKELRAEIGRMVDEFYDVKFGQTTFMAGKSVVRFAGCVFDAEEIKAGVDTTRLR